MAHKLISFLGKVRKEHGQRYREATYHFDPGIDKKTRFFGLALQEHLQPDELIILGTTGSMWDVFFDSLEISGDDTLLDAQVELEAAVQEDRVTPGQLHWLEGEVSHKLGLPCTLRLIPYGTTPNEQITILQIMVSRFANGDQASLDVTHGLRHLPMLSLVSAVYLQVAFKVAVQGLYYGALDLTRDDLTPVMRLDGLLRITDWVGALHTFDKDGDYGVFADLLKDELAPEARGLLEEAAFLERNSRVGQARGKLRTFETALNQQGLGHIGRLFEPSLRTRIAWCHEERLYQRQQALARQNLERGDFLRAALFAYEAFITRLVQREGGGNPDNWEVRDAAKQAYETTQKQQRPRTGEFERYCLLRDLRNQLAHGNTQPRGDVQSAVSSAAALREVLNRLINQLLPET